jgi:hypothetical protein
LKAKTSESKTASKTKSRGITDRSVEIVDAVYRYRLLPTSMMLRLVGGNEDVTYRHLLRLHKAGLLNRFSLPRQGAPGEFIYYIDNTKSLDLLVESGRFSADALDWDSIKRNRARDYAEDASDSRLGRFLFVEHELVISRFHFMLEIACRNSEGSIKLFRWQQGADLWDRALGSDEDGTHPHRPDAFFSLQFPNAPEESKFGHFFYEADRKRSSSTRFIKKMKSYFEFLVQRQHETKYGIKRVRAILVETADSAWAEVLRDAALEADVDAKSVPLFWFTTSEIFTHQSSKSKNALPRYLRDPGVVLEPIWLSTTSDELFGIGK